MQSALLAEHADRKPGLMALVLGKHPVERDAYIIATPDGRVTLSINPAGQLIVRPGAGKRLFSAITAKIKTDGSWDERQQGWRIQAESAANVLARLLSMRRDIDDVVNPHRHPASPQKPLSIAIHSTFGIATGEVVGDMATLRILDARLRALLYRAPPCGIYEEGAAMGTWRFPKSELENVRQWTERLR